MAIRKNINGDQKHIVIIGGGAIGCCTAYFLSSHPSYDPKRHIITLVEATRIAGGSSGKAAGCLGEWADPACIAPASFRLHADLSEKHDGENIWGYRKVFSADCDTTKKHPHDPDAETPVSREVDWVDASKFKWYKPLGKTAQVHPYQFTTNMARLASEQGVAFVEGKVESINYDTSGKEVQAVTVRRRDSETTEQILATDIVVAAGPWTKLILPEAPIGGQKSHAIVVDPHREIQPTILFFDPGHIDMDEENQLEIYPRPDHTVYMSGQTDYGLEIPPTTGDVHPDPERCQQLMDNVAIVSPELAKSEVLIRQACFRPIVNVEGRDPELGPLLGFTGISGLILAAGHNQWGIQNSPITGKVISEMIYEGKAISADISQLDPREHLKFT